MVPACGSAHHWARVFNSRGVEVILLPARYVRAYVRRSKTDAADTLALLEAARCADIVLVKIKLVEQQSLQALHRIRSLWMGTRTSRTTRCAAFAANSRCPRLREHVRGAIRQSQYSYRTGQAYIHWIKRYVLFHARSIRNRLACPKSHNF